MAFYLSINDDTDNKIEMSFFNESIRFQYEDTNMNRVNSIRYELLCNIVYNENYEDVQEYIVPFCTPHSITNISILNDNEVIYNTANYSSIEALYVRPDENNNEITFTIHFSKEATI